MNRFADTPATGAGFMADATGSAVLDGEELAPERRAADAVVIEATEGSALGLDAGRWTATACGLWARFGPLEPGDHRLPIRGATSGFEVAVDYTLRVGDPA